MYASCIHPKSDTSPQNSGSESTPLISSESRTSLEPTLFDDSETTDLDLNSAGCSLKYRIFMIDQIDSYIINISMMIRCLCSFSLDMGAQTSAIIE